MESGRIIGLFPIITDQCLGGGQVRTEMVPLPESAQLIDRVPAPDSSRRE